MLRQIMLALGALGLVAAGLPPATPAAPETKGRIRALVIGVVNYKDGIASPMIGAFNDSVLIAETLIREGAKAEDVTLLLDPPTPELLAARGNPRMRQTKVKPDAVGTRANILAAMKRIVDTTKPGDEVLLAFSGHGMQQNEAVAGSEPDGLDEVFLPYDTGPANGSEKIENAVTDDEIGAVIDAIRAKGGNVTYIADFCHSGDSNRDAAGKDNGAPTSTKLGLKVSRKFATVRDGNFVRDLAVETSKGKAGWGAYVGLLAVPSAQQAKQYQAPRYADPLEQAAHGLLTVYAMANWNNPRVYSYRDLANRITAGIDGHKSPRPEFDGDLDRPVMGGLMKTALAAQGGGSWAVYKPARVFTAETKSTDPVKLEQLEMSAGQLQGVIEGAIIGLALTSPAGDKTILYGRVDKADAYKAILVPTAFGDIPAEAWNDVRDIDGKPLSREVRLVATIEQQPIQLDYRIALPAAPASPSKAQAAALAALKEIKPADIGASFVQPGEAADLLLTFNGDKLALTQPPGQVTADFGSIDLAAALAQDGSNPTIRVRFAIGGALVKATRFSRLQRVLASPALASGQPSEDPAKHVAVEFYVARPKALAAGAACPDTTADYYAVAKDARRVGGDGSEAGGFRFQRCDWLFIKVTNTGKTDLYVNPLIFSPDGGILLFDGQDGRFQIKADNPTRLRAGESGVLQYSLTDASPGGDLRDDLVLLVSDVTDGVPLSYARLAQCPVVPGPEDGAACATAAGPTLAGTRLRNNGGAGTGIEELIDSALVGSTMRSGPAKKPTAVSALRFSWQTERTDRQ